MYFLKWISAADTESVEDRPLIAITPTGLLLTGEIRSHQDRSAGEFVPLHDPCVTSGGRGHCHLWISDDEVFVCDYGSDNGTWIGHGTSLQRITGFAKATKLVEGAELMVGRCRFRLIKGAVRL